MEICGGNIYRSKPESLAKWSKSIIRSDTTNPTITLIFRKLIEPPRKVIPPLGLPGHNMNPKRDILFGKNTKFSSVKNKRTLLLTDSILSAVNPQSLTTSKHEICVKKMLYYITDFSNYEAEFEYTGKVILSAGINDIT